MILKRIAFALLMLVTTVFVVATGLFTEYDEMPLFLAEQALNIEPSIEFTPITPVPTVTAGLIVSNEAVSYKTTPPTVTPEPTKQPPTWDDWSYTSEDLHITVEQVTGDRLVYYVADVRMQPENASVQLKSAFAQERFGRNIREQAHEMAQRKSAILAINADYYGYHSSGVMIREGKLYRNKPYGVDTLIIGADGVMDSQPDSDVDASALLDSGVRNTFNFGPTIVRDGLAVDTGSKSRNPRTAIGMAEPGHYIVIVADGRSQASRGLTLSELAQLFIDRGAQFAYNLDGGGSSTMVFMGRVLNNPSDDLGERKTSDILYFQDLDIALAEQNTVDTGTSGAE